LSVEAITNGFWSQNTLSSLSVWFVSWPLAFLASSTIVFINNSSDLVI
jgi:hypothetical protein